MKFLLDQGVPRTAVEALRQFGFEAVHVGVLGMATASDEDILHRALREGETIITFDADFHARLALSGTAAPSVIRVRIERLKGSDLASLISRVVAACQKELEGGAMVTVDTHSIRLRTLPLGSR